MIPFRYKACSILVPPMQIGTFMSGLKILVPYCKNSTQFAHNEQSNYFSDTHEISEDDRAAIKREMNTTLVV